MSSTVLHRDLDKGGHSRSSRSGLITLKKEKEREGEKERGRKREKHVFPTVTVPTRPNLMKSRPTLTPTKFWVCFLCPLRVCFGSAMVAPELIVSRPQADPEQTPISGADPLQKNVHVCMEYTKGWLTGSKKKDRSASHFSV